jgi:hypothetical protein
MGPNRRAQERERAAAEATAKVKRSEAERKAIADAHKIVAMWFYPTIGAASRQGSPGCHSPAGPAVSLARLICPRSTGIPARRFRASSHQCHGAGVRRTHRSRDWKC